MQTFVVGGAVRDQLLGLASRDEDHVVVGATPEEMIAQGFRPVGADFPVFLHPRTQEEYALARTERKTAPGYKGFVFHTSPDVTLEQDLQRRDLTVNAMARAEDGSLIDPYGGMRDLNDRILRHVSAAFREDPVRILRVARFAARFAALNFRVAPETLSLMQSMTSAGEVDALVPERVWQELARGLMEATPSRMIEVLRECAALAHLLPEVENLFYAGPGAAEDPGHVALRALDRAAQCEVPLPVRFAVLTFDLALARVSIRASAPEQQVQQNVALLRTLAARNKVPNECFHLALTLAERYSAVINSTRLDAEGLLDLLEGADALRRPERFGELLQACEIIHWARTGAAASTFSQAPFLNAAVACLTQLDLASVAAQGGDIPANIRKHKLAALEHFHKENQP